MSMLKRWDGGFWDKRQVRAILKAIAKDRHASVFCFNRGSCSRLTVIPIRYSDLGYALRTWPTYYTGNESVSYAFRLFLLWYKYGITAKKGRRYLSVCSDFQGRHTYEEHFPEEEAQWGV